MTAKESLKARTAEVTLTRDEFRDARGGDSSLLLVFCATCSRELFLYQKDGGGPLLRCYLNRVHRDPGLGSRLGQGPAGSYLCLECGAQVGVPTTYQDGRTAIHLAEGAVRAVVLRREGSDEGDDEDDAEGEHRQAGLGEEADP